MSDTKITIERYPVIGGTTQDDTRPKLSPGESVRQVRLAQHRDDDPVNHPAHYTYGGVEVLDCIEQWGLGYRAGNVLKYVVRARHKGDELQDLRKALFYLRRMRHTRPPACVDVLASEPLSGVHDAVCAWGLGYDEGTVVVAMLNGAYFEAEQALERCIERLEPE